MLSRTSRILLVAAVLAVGAYLLIDRKPERGADDEPARLATFDITRVDGVILERESEALRFAREDSLWRMTGPLSDVAEPSTVISLLDALEHADIARNLGATNDLSPFGLAPPLVRITLLSGADTLLIAAFGKRTVDDAWTYARARSNELLLVPTNISRAATLPVDAYRNQRVVDFQLTKIEGYRLWTPDHETAWTRGRRGWFTTEHGDTIRADSVAVESVLRRLRGLRASAFVDTLNGGLERPLAGVITLWTTDGAPARTLHFTPGANGAWRAQDLVTGRVVFIEDAIDDLLAHTTTELRDRRLLQFSPTDAERIEVALPDASGAIVRSGGAWSFPNPALGRIDADHAADFVRALRSLKWTGLPARGAPAHLDASHFSITVKSASGTLLDEMRAEPRPDGVWYVTSRSSHGVWMLEREHLAALADRFAQLKAP